MQVSCEPDMDLILAVLDGAALPDQDAEFERRYLEDHEFYMLARSMETRHAEARPGERGFNWERSLELGDEDEEGDEE